MSIAQHSNATFEHGTPEWVLDLVRKSSGGVIDVDPCSTAKFNETVDATVYYTKEQDGLLQPWGGSVWVNPPGGRMLPPAGYEYEIPETVYQQLREQNEKDFSAPAFWWQHTWRKWVRKEIEQAHFMCFNPELIRYAQQFPQVGHPLEYSVVVFRKRLEFLDSNLEPQTTPAHMSMLFWLPPSDNMTAALDRFWFTWAPYGHVHHHTTVRR